MRVASLQSNLLQVTAALAELGLSVPGVLAQKSSCQGRDTSRNPTA